MKEKLNKGRYFQGNRFISEEVNLKTSLDIPVMSSIVQKCYYSPGKISVRGSNVSSFRVIQFHTFQ